MMTNNVISDYLLQAYCQSEMIDSVLANIIEYCEYKRKSYDCQISKQFNAQSLSYIIHSLDDKNISDNNLKSMSSLAAKMNDNELYDSISKIDRIMNYD